MGIMGIISKLQEVINGGKKTSDVLEGAKENITKGLISTNSDHSAIHKGFGYCAHLYFDELEYGEKKIYRWRAPENLFCHIKSIQAGAIGATIKVKLIKDVTITNAGTEESCLCNLNHNIEKPAQSKIYDGDVTYTGGNTWCEVIIRGFTSGETKYTPQQQSAGQFIQNDYIEYVTKDGNEEYIIELENIDGEENTAYDLTLDLFFYEEPEGVFNND